MSNDLKVWAIESRGHPPAYFRGTEEEATSVRKVAMMNLDPAATMRALSKEEIAKLTHEDLPEHGL